MMGVPQDLLRVGQVLYEDDDHIVLKVLKDDNKTYDVTKHPVFLTIAFCHNVRGKAMPWLPWRNRN
jgi:hypothetical protein